MPMNFSKLLLIAFVFFGLTSTAQQKSPKDLMARYLDSAYTEKPKDILDSATKFLDSMAISDQCFKFIFNKNHTKFLAFYIVEKKSKGHKNLKLEYGAHFKSFKNAPKAKGKFKALAYTVVGILQNGKWIFDLEEYVRLAGKDMNAVQEDMMFLTLTERVFFKPNSLKENKKFWSANNFATEKTENGKKVVSLILHSQSAKEKREKLKVNFKLEKLAEIKTDSLWTKLNSSDTNHYNARLQDKEEDDIYYVLYNSNRSKVLIPLVFTDSKKQMYLAYYYFTPSDTTNSIYQWRTYPERKTEKIQDQKMDIIKDIRKFSINWLWNTQNFIEEEEFWRDNFGSSNLDLIMKQ
jgi:hypothetical protein